MSLHPPFYSTFKDNENPKRKVHSEIRPKTIRVFFDLKKYRTDLLTQKKYRACKFSTQKNTSDPPCHVYFEYPPPPPPPPPPGSRPQVRKIRPLYICLKY